MYNLSNVKRRSGYLVSYPIILLSTRIRFHIILVFGSSYSVIWRWVGEAWEWMDHLSRGLVARQWAPDFKSSIFRRLLPISPFFFMAGSLPL